MVALFHGQMRRGAAGARTHGVPARPGGPSGMGREPLRESAAARAASFTHTYLLLNRGTVWRKPWFQLSQKLVFLLALVSVWGGAPLMNV